MAEESKRVFEGKEVLYIVGLVFLACAIIAGLGFVLVDHAKAVTALDISGISVSIVLAIIAIVYTMVDTSGQKELVASMSLNVRELEQKVGEFTPMVEELKSNIMDLKGAVQDVSSNDAMVQAVANLQQMQQSLLEIIEQSKSDVDRPITAEDLVRVLDLRDRRTRNRASHGQPLPKLTLTHNFEVRAMYGITANESIIVKQVEAAIQNAFFSVSSGFLNVQGTLFSQQEKTIDFAVIFSSENVETVERVRDAILNIGSKDFKIVSVK